MVYLTKLFTEELNKFDNPKDSIPIVSNRKMIVKAFDEKSAQITLSFMDEFSMATLPNKIHPKITTPDIISSLKP
ncbi:MAG: hypothetical protein HZB50_07090 [Chloroflexi bacterium]|nr:hypothetical protein [Chloroflexota bacterium]